MPYPPIKPDAQRSTAFRAFVSYLRMHPALKVVRTWRTWDGGEDDVAAPNVDECPWVRLTPLAMPQSRVAVLPGRQSVTRSPIRVAVELVVAGTRVDDLASLWERFERVVMPRNPGERAALDAAMNGSGVRDIRVTQAAAFPTSLGYLGDDDGLSLGDGSIELDVFLGT